MIGGMSKSSRAQVYAMPKPKRTKVPWYEFKAQAEDDDTVAELNIFGPIGGGIFADPDAPSGKRIAQQLEELPESVETIRVFVNSPGGNVFDAQHIFNALRRQREDVGRNVVVDIEAAALSAATLVTSAGDPIRMPRNAMMMVHNPWSLGIGDFKVMRGLADTLEKIKGTLVATYRYVSKKSEKQLGELMDATTWMDADEALANGFITEVTTPVKAAAQFDAQMLAQLGDQIPEKYRDRVVALFASETEEEEVEEPADPADNDEPEEEPAGEVEQPGEDDAGDDEGADASAEPSEVEMTDKEKKELKAAAAKAERERISGIDKAIKGGVAAGLADEDMKVLAKKAKDEDWTVEKTGGEILNRLAERDEQADGPDANAQRPDIVPGEDEHDKRVSGIQGALLARSTAARGAIQAAAKKFPDNPAFRDIDYGGGEFRHMSLFELAKADLKRMRPGVSLSGPPREIVGKFFNAVGNYQTTSDYAVALENTMHKTLLAAFSIAPDTWRSICAIGEVSDFRAHNRYRTGYIASLDQIYEHGEFTNKTIPDAVKETITALTYGNIVGLSRQAIINDDMGVFNRVAMQVGRAAALTIEEGFYSLLGQNSGLGPGMNDGNPLFDASHSNISGGAALSAAAIDDDAELLESQQDPNSQEYLSLRPSILLVPRGLRSTALTINESRFDPDTADSNKPNTVLGLFDQVIATVRLSGTRRYLFADPMEIPTFEVAFLNGEQEPFMEMKDGWRTDGVEWKVRHDFGIAAVEYRSAVTDAGA